MSRRGIEELDAVRDDPANQSGTGAWARAQSDDALQDQLDYVEPGTRSYEAASRELARRDANRSEQIQLVWIMRTFWATVILGIVAIGATLFA